MGERGLLPELLAYAADGALNFADMGRLLRDAQDGAVQLVDEVRRRGLLVAAWEVTPPPRDVLIGQLKGAGFAEVAAEELAAKPPEYEPPAEAQPPAEAPDPGVQTSFERTAAALRRRSSPDEVAR